MYTCSTSFQKYIYLILTQIIKVCKRKYYYKFTYKLMQLNYLLILIKQYFPLKDVMVIANKNKATYTE